MTGAIVELSEEIANSGTSRYCVGNAISSAVFYPWSVFDPVMRSQMSNFRACLTFTSLFLKTSSQLLMLSMLKTISCRELKLLPTCPPFNCEN